MESRPHEEGDLRLYLLGLLPQERARPLEERLLSDGSFYEELVIAEDELIDEYLDGELDGRELERFNGHFLNSPHRMSRVRFARTLKRYVAETDAAAVAETPAPAEDPASGIKPERGGGRFLPWPRVPGPAPAAYLAVALLVSCAITWVVIRSMSSGAPRQVATVLLTPGGQTRAGGDLQLVDIPVGADVVQLRLRLVAVDFQSYHATLLNEDGVLLLNASNLKPEPVEGTQAIVMTLPARNIQPGGYQLRLDGVYPDGNSESIDAYRFKVVRR
jgi:hypothetical protein